jgi:hypothetical protein
MPAGDAGVTWFSEMIEALRQECKPEMGQEELTALRDHLDTMLNRIDSPEVSGRRQCGALSATSAHNRQRRVFRFGR